MTKRSAVQSLPRDVKAWLDKALAEGGFQRYRLLEEELRARGYNISKSSIQRYGAAFETRLASLKLATEQARAVVEASPDREGATNEALMRLVQEKLFGVLVDLDVKVETLHLDKITKSIADLARAAVTQKRFAAEAREAARRELREEMNAKIESLGSAQDLKALSDEELEARIAALAVEA
jgi:hypothetical protein